MRKIFIILALTSISFVGSSSDKLWKLDPESDYCIFKAKDGLKYCFGDDVDLYLRPNDYPEYYQ